MDQQPAPRVICCAGPVAAVGGFLPVHEYLAILSIGIDEQSGIGKRFVRRHGGAEPDDIGALGWSAFGAEPVSSARARIGGSDLAARRIAFVEKPGTVETRRFVGAVRHDRLGASERRNGERDQCQCNKETGTAQRAWPPGDIEILSQRRRSSKLRVHNREALNSSRCNWPSHPFLASCGLSCR